MERTQWMIDTVEQLNHLIQLDFDAVRTYQQALSHVDEDRVRRDLMSFMNDHERHIMETTRVIREMESEPIDVHRDFKGALLEGMTWLRSVTGTLGALRAMRMNERLTNRTYGKVAHLNFPPLAAVLVDQNFRDEQRHLALIESHISRLSRRGVAVPETRASL